MDERASNFGAAVAKAVEQLSTVGVQGSMKSILFNSRLCTF